VSGRCWESARRHELLRCSSEEDLLGVGGDDAVEAELAGVLGAQLEE
jgi:hypothetical protein